MKTFKEFCDENQYSVHCTRNEAFKIGQISCRAEIERTKADSQGASIGHDVFIKQLKERHKVEIDKLKCRIDEALGHAVNHGGYDDLTHIVDILRGEK